MKARIRYFLAMIGAMALGFGSRRYADMLPDFVAEHAGDALWASMVYFGVRTVWVKMRLLGAALVSVLFCFGIELSQLYQAEWVNSIRSTFVGALVLGRGFLYVDLARYSLGIIISLLIEAAFVKRGTRG